MAYSFYLKVKGTKQGEFKGEGIKHQTNIPILGFSYNVRSPLEMTSGQTSGKRQHKPVTVFKEWGVVSPQLMQAMVTAERLTSVIIEEARTRPNGTEEVYLEIRLTNAIISEISIEPERSDDQPIWMNREIEQVSFIFEKIEFENHVSKAVAVDDWQQSA